MNRLPSALPRILGSHAGELLEIPEPWATAAFVPIGWPVGGGHGLISRRPVEEVVFSDRFGNALIRSQQEEA